MEEGTGGNGGGDGGDVRPRNEVETSGPPINDQSTGRVSACSSAKGLSSGGGEGGRAQEVGGDADRRMSVTEWHTPVSGEAEGLRVCRLGSRGAVEGIVLHRRGFRGRPQ